MSTVVTQNQSKTVSGLFFIIFSAIVGIFAFIGFLNLYGSFSQSSKESTVSMASTSTLAAPTSYTKPLMKTSKLTFIFHGTPLGTRQAKTLEDGKLIPLGGPATSQQHLYGDDRSPFNTATTNPYQAYLDATAMGTPGRFSSKAVDLNSAPYIDAKDLSCGDVFGEKSILIKGLSNGWSSVIVQPGMNQSQFWNWFNVKMF